MTHTEPTMDTYLGWLMMAASVALDFMHKHVHLPMLMISPENVDFAISQVLHTVQIVGIVIGVFYSYKGYKNSLPKAESKEYQND